MCMAKLFVLDERLSIISDKIRLVETVAMTLYILNKLHLCKVVKLVNAKFDVSNSTNSRDLCTYSFKDREN